MSAEHVDRVAALVERESGIVLGRAGYGSLRAAIARVSRGMTAERLLASPTRAATLERLIDEITVRETFFFRHPAEFAEIDWHGAWQTARGRGADAVRVWTAGCASGEEAYTMAILACEAFGSTEPPVRILATDIAASALAQARGGRYGTRAVRSLEDGVRRRYFDAQNGTLRVNERLRRMVEVRRHNLVTEKSPPVGCQPFDLILCRNVLIYFAPETVDRVVAALRTALWPGGRLVLGAADRLSRGSPIPTLGGVSDLHRRRTPTRTSVRPGIGPPDLRGPHAARAEPPSAPSAPSDGRAHALSPAMQAADRGDIETALRMAGAALAENPLDAEAHFITGIAELARDAPQAAVDSLRRALYADPRSSLAAFHLARAHDALGERAPARRAYEQVLRTLDRDNEEHSVARQRDLDDITVACRARLGALAGAS